MKTPKYYIAKYIPDLRRGEPRNIGIVLWTADRTIARFLAEEPDSPGKVDGRSLQGFIGSTSAYKQWVAFWQSEIAKDEVVPTGSTERVAKGCAQFVEALASFSKGNFFLAEGGFLLDPLEPDEMETALTHLFQTLVVQSAEEPRDPSLDEICERLINEAGLPGNPYFKSAYPVNVTLAPGVEERLEFSHAYGNGSPKRLYQRVPLSKQRTPRRKSVHDTAWMFEKVTAGIVTKEAAIALVHATPEEAADADVARLLRVLGSVCRVLNVNNQEEALDEFRRLPEIVLH